MNVEDKIERLLSCKFEEDKRCEGVLIPYDFELKLVLEMIIQKSGIDDEYIHVNVMDSKKLNRNMKFDKNVTYLQILKQICLENQLDILLDDNGIFIME